MSKVGFAAPLGLLIVDQVYVRFASPPSSEPTTLSAAVAPSTGLGLADGGVATVGTGSRCSRFASGGVCFESPPPDMAQLSDWPPLDSKKPSLNECQPTSRMIVP